MICGVHSYLDISSMNGTAFALRSARIPIFQPLLIVMCLNAIHRCFVRPNPAAGLQFRRTLFAGLLLIAILPGADAAAAAKSKSSPVTQPVAKHIILFIGDGMQLEQEIATSRYLFGRDTALSFHRFPYQNSLTTWDVTTYNQYARVSKLPLYDPQRIIPSVGYDPVKGGSSPCPIQRDGISDDYFLKPDGEKWRTFATDSASAATAWATGHKTDDGNLAWLPGDPPGGRLATLAELLRREKGYALGIVSTVPFSHATPAAHVSHSTDRDDYHAIAREILLEMKPEVVIGGGHPLYEGKCPDPESQCSPTFISLQLYRAMKTLDKQDYAFVERVMGQDGAISLLRKAQDAAKDGKMLFGLFGGMRGNFESPVPQDLPGTPLVNRAALENPLLRDATLAALKVLSQDRDGFFLMVEQGDIDWANHANDYGRMIGTIWDLHMAVQAAVDFVNREGDAVTWGNTLFIVTSDHATGYMRLNRDKSLGAGDLPLQEPSGRTHRYPNGEVTYGTSRHTNELARIYAMGKPAVHFEKCEGQWYPCQRLMDNTHLFHVMTEAAGVPRESPLKVLVKRVRCSEKRRPFDVDYESQVQEPALKNREKRATR